MRHTGETKQYLHKRCSKHLSSIKNNKAEASAKNSFRKNHQFDLKQFKILAYETDYTKQYLLKMIHIKNDISNHIDIQNLPQIYSNLIN